MRKRLQNLALFCSDVMFNVGQKVYQVIFRLPKKQARKGGYILAIPAEFVYAALWKPRFYGLNLPWAS